MAPTFTIDGYDISSYILWGDRAHDFGQPLSPQFGGNVAFNDGMPWVRTSASNREWSIPLLLDGTTDVIHNLVQTINAHLFQGAQVAFKPAGATKTSYFDLEEGFLDPKWDLYEDTAGVLRAGLRLYTRPYATTGTTRLVASGIASGPLTYSVTGITGDVAALARVEHRQASQLESPLLDSHWVWAWGIHRSASYVPVRAAASFVLPAGATVIGASGAIGSQYIALPSNVGTFDFTSYLAPGDAYTGAHRVLAVVAHAISPASAVWISMQAYNAAANSQADFGVGTVVASVVSGTTTTFGLFDLGEFRVPSAPAGESVATHTLIAKVRIAAGASYVASPIVRLNGLIMVPISESAQIVRAQYASPASPVVAAESYPVARTRLFTSASTLRTDLLPFVRGAPPQVPPTGSPVASGAMTVVQFAGNPNGFVGNTVHSFGLSVRERWSYLR